MEKNNFNNNKNCMNCKNVVADFLAYLNSYLDFSPKTSVLNLPMLQVLKLFRNEVIVSSYGIYRNQIIDFCKSYREPLTLFVEDDKQYFAAKHIANSLGLQPSYLSWLRGGFRMKKSGLTKYLQTVFITLHFI
ncbi:MAG: hypothetical protein WC623_13275 [Pedobacter sp.]|uniref:hypothetical protein n=1 Tax=Pedobacter sp. TaxID=1411316 RepID=UPI0035622C65